MIKQTTLIIILVIVTASIGGGAYSGYRYSQLQTESQLIQLHTQLSNLQLNYTTTLGENKALKQSLPTLPKIVKIGYIANLDDDYLKEKQYIKQIIEPDINNYAKKLGYDVSFYFNVTQVDQVGTSPTYLEELQSMKKSGTNIIISNYPSSLLTRANTSLAYMKSNNMLFIDPWEIQTGKSKPGVFSLQQKIPVKSLVDVMWSYGIKDVIILQIRSAAIDPYATEFENTWIEKGGEIAGPPLEYSYLEGYIETLMLSANEQAIAARAKYPTGDKIAVLMIYDYYGETLVGYMKDYQPLYNCTVFSEGFGEGTNWVDDIANKYINNVPGQASHLKVFSLDYILPSSSEGLGRRFAEVTGKKLYFLDANLYDAAWAVAESVFGARSVEPSRVADVLPDVCSRLYGASGSCRLDQFGDRVPTPMNVWFYAPNSTGGTSKYLAGVYNPDASYMSWDASRLRLVPAGP